MIVYLSGAIEHSPDRGRAWRKDIEIFLRNILEHDVYNPSEDIKENITVEEDMNFRRWKKTDRKRFLGVVKKIIDYDLDYIESKVDYIICYWDKWCEKGGGTHGEITVAYRKGIPVYMVSEMQFDSISAWVLGCTKKFFSSFSELKTFLLRKYGQKVAGRES